MKRYAYCSRDRGRRGDLLRLLGLGCLGVAVSQIAFTFGVSMTSASNTGLVFATAPVWGLLLGAALSYSAVLATAFAFTAWQKGISRTCANRVLVYQYLITLTGVASGVVFRRAPGSEQARGRAVIFVGVYLARRQ